MLSRSDDNWADIDYFFAQVSVEKQLVDYKPTCGNMLTAVGPAAIEMGLVPASDQVTEIRIRAVNTERKGDLTSPDNQQKSELLRKRYAIDGVPGPLHRSNYFS